MRRISTGIVGREILGRFTAFDNSLRSIENNQDIVLNPNGSGIIRSDAHIQVNDENSVRFADSGSSNYVEIKAPASLGSNITLTLPDSTTAGNVLTTDGSGNLTFSDLTIEVSNQSAATDTYYPLLSTSDSGSISSVDVSSSKLSFQPSSGTLTVTDLSTTDINCTDITCTDITASGDLEAGTITETSSRALKTDINPISNAVDAIFALEGVSYTRISSGRRESGLIAEDVEKVLPELVDSKGEYKSISYSRLTAYLIEAVKSLKIELDEVKR